MRDFVLWLLVLCFFLALSLGFAMFVGIWFPALRLPIAAGLGAYWMWTAWKYAGFLVARRRLSGR